MRRTMHTRFEVTTSDGTTWTGDCPVWAAGFPRSAKVRRIPTMVLTTARRLASGHFDTCGERH